MNTNKAKSNTLIKGGLLAVSLCLHMPLVVLAQGAAPSSSQESSFSPSIAQSQPSVQSPAATETETVLQGSAKKQGEATTDSLNGAASAAAAGTGTSLDGSAQDVQLQAATPTLDEGQKFELSATKLASGAKMDTNDFRNLGIGTFGMEEKVYTWSKYPKVEAVFAGSPAEAAGIKVGDLVIKSEGSTQRPGPWDGEKWQFHFDHVGTQAEITIRRGKEEMTFNLTRINIEDLPDPKIRRIYEEQAKKLGGDAHGTITTSDRPTGLKGLWRLLPIPSI